MVLSVIDQKIRPGSHKDVRSDTEVVKEWLIRGIMIAKNNWIWALDLQHSDISQSLKF